MTAVSDPAKASATKAAQRSRSAMTTSIRRERRSASAPKNGPSAIAGTQSASRTAATAQAEWVMS